MIFGAFEKISVRLTFRLTGGKTHYTHFCTEAHGETEAQYGRPASHRREGDHRCLSVLCKLGGTVIQDGMVGEKIWSM